MKLANYLSADIKFSISSCLLCGSCLALLAPDLQRLQFSYFSVNTYCVGPTCFPSILSFFAAFLYWVFWTAAVGISRNLWCF